MMNTIITILGLALLGSVKLAHSTTEEEYVDIVEEGPCYEGLGCFPNVKPWRSFWRQVPRPSTPQEVNTQIFCYTRESPESFNITLWPSISLNGLPFSASRATVFITHGFASNGHESWLKNMKDAYLGAVDANVCLVDWGKGAGHANYLKVASNTRIVGAEMGRFIKWLQKEHGLSASKVHLIGHSLGSHISSYAAKAVGNVARITGLDVAQPAFEGYDNEVRLDKSDADFVEAIHTNGAPFLPNRGLGFVDPVGHVDFYMNSGRIQPGCALLDHFSEGLNLVGLASLASFTVDKLVEWGGCNHGRSFHYFTEALRGDCPHWGLASTMRTFKLLGNTDVNVKAEECTPDTCVPLGLYTPEFSGRGVFTVITEETAPFCNLEENSVIVARLISIKDSLTEAAKKALGHFFMAV